jgi:tetratricopeptide (TPR) repeat protein
MTRGIVALALSLAGILAAAAPAVAQDAEGEGDLGLGFDDEAQPADDAETPPEEAEVEPEPAVRNPAAAKKLADGAAKFVKKGDKLKKRKKVAEATAEYERALMAYDKSFELDPRASVLLQTAVLSARLERWVDAATRYKRAMAETEIPLDAKSRAKAQAALDQVMLSLGLVTLTVIPEGATITVDGVELGLTPLAEPLMLAPGEHAVSLAAEGYLPTETRITVEGGSESERSFELKPVPVVVEKPRPPPPPPPPPPPLPDKPSALPWIAGAGATAAFTIGAVITGIVAVGKHSTFTDPMSTEAERSSAQSSGRTFAHLTDAFTGVAVVSAGFTAYYYLKIYRPKASARREAEQERAGMHDEMGLIVVPSAGPDFGGLVLSGRF